MPISARETAFGLLLRDARIRSGWTLDRVAQVIGWTKGRIFSLETGRSVNLTHAECTALERDLGIPPGELWSALLLDPRKLCPDVRANARLRAKLAAVSRILEGP